ncbi:MAG: hypothetical protein ACXWEY_01830 [Bacteroidia bacterium]
MAQHSDKAADSVWQQYEKHFSAGQYMEALHEIKRLKFIGYLPVEEIYYATANIYKAKKNWDSAYNNYYKVVQKGNSIKYYHAALYNCQLMSYMKGNILDEVFYYRTIQREKDLPDSIYFDSEFISMLSDLKVYNWDGAKQSCKQLFKDTLYNWDSVFIALSPTNLKSSKRAFRLSAIPGAGQFYAGYPSRALQSFLLQTAIAAGITAAVITESYVIGGLFLAPMLLRLHYAGKLFAFKMVEVENENENRAAASKLRNIILQYAQVNGEI